MDHRQVEGGHRTDACPGGGLDTAYELGGSGACEARRIAARDGDWPGRRPGPS